MGESLPVPNIGVASPLPDYHGHHPEVTHAHQGLTQAVWTRCDSRTNPTVEVPLAKLAPAESKLLCPNTFYTFAQ